MKANQADLPVRTMCRVLRVSASGYYDWLERVSSARARANAELMQRVSEIHRASDATYGALASMPNWSIKALSPAATASPGSGGCTACAASAVDGAGA